jgi:hypothetical protein
MNTKHSLFGMDKICHQTQQNIAASMLQGAGEVADNNADNVVDNSVDKNKDWGRICPFEIGSAVGRSRRTVGRCQPIDFNPCIDVHGMRVAEAMSTIEIWLDRALLSSFTTVKIMHGKGNGILKMHIRSYLQTLPFVQDFYDEHFACGGGGITVVKIN